MSDVVFGESLYDHWLTEAKLAHVEHLRRAIGSTAPLTRTGFEHLSDQELNALIRRNQQDPRA